MTTRITQSQVAQLRATLASRQQHVCPLCHGPIQSPVLDHDHTSGRVRSVLCRTCNSALGVIENFRARFNFKDSAKLAKFLQAVVPYIERHNMVPSEYVHHTFRTPDEKTALVAKRAKAKRAKAKESLQCVES